MHVFLFFWCYSVELDEWCVWRYIYINCVYIAALVPSVVFRCKHPLFERLFRLTRLFTINDMRERNNDIKTRRGTIISTDCEVKGVNAGVFVPSAGCVSVWVAVVWIWSVWVSRGQWRISANHCEDWTAASTHPATVCRRSPTPVSYTRHSFSYLLQCCF